MTLSQHYLIEQNEANIKFLYRDVLKDSQEC